MPDPIIGNYNTVTVDGYNPATGDTTLDGGRQFRGLFVEGGNVTIQNLTIADAAATGGAGGAGLSACDGGGAGRQRQAWRSA